VVSLQQPLPEVIRQRELTMMKSTLKAAGIAMTAAVLAGAMGSAQASGQLPIFKACLAKAETAPDPKSARDQCVWHHWDLMSEYD
jgi:hypothetical protein